MLAIGNKPFSINFIKYFSPEMICSVNKYKYICMIWVKNSFYENYNINI